MQPAPRRRNKSACVDKGARRWAPACRLVPSCAWPVRPLRLPDATRRPREAQKITPRFDGLFGFPPLPGCRDPASGSRHTVGVAGPGARRIRLAQGGNCEGPLIRRRWTFTASGTTVGGMNPGQATEPGSFSKTAGPASPRKLVCTRLGRSTRQGPQPGQDPRLSKVCRPGRNSWRKTTQPGTAMASPASQPTRGVHGNPATGQLPSHPGRTMGQDDNHR